MKNQLLININRIKNQRAKSNLVNCFKLIYHMMLIHFISLLIEYMIHIRLTHAFCDQSNRRVSKFRKKSHYRFKMALFMSFGES